MENKVFVSIASFRDTELLPTVTRLLENASSPESIYLFVVSQDLDEMHPDLESIVSKYNSHLNYEKIHYTQTKGVCWARARIQENLNLEFKYYLQLDSHMAFVLNWDSILIKDYENALEDTGDFIYTVYPAGYYYEDNRLVLHNVPYIPRVPIYIEGRQTKFLTKEVKMFASEVFPKKHGEKSFWYSGNFAFGHSRYFLETPYDSNFFFDGEEHSMTLRMFSKGVAFLSPPRRSVYHYYLKDLKVYVHDNQELFADCYARANERIEDFFNFRIEGEFGITPDIIYRWLLESRDNR